MPNRTEEAQRSISKKNIRFHDPNQTGSESPDALKLDENEDFDKDIDTVKIPVKPSPNLKRAQTLEQGTTFKEWFISLFKPSAKSRALEKGKSEVLKHVDVFSIIRRFQEIDNLKACLLTEHQRVVFDNIAKPSLVINKGVNPKDKDFITIEGWDQSYRGRKEKLYESYRGLLLAEDQTEVNRQILELFENGLTDEEFDEMDRMIKQGN